MRLHFPISIGVLCAAVSACSGAETSTGTAQSGVSSNLEALPPTPPKPPQEAFDA